MRSSWIALSHDSAPMCDTATWLLPRQQGPSELFCRAMARTEEDDAGAAQQSQRHLQPPLHAARQRVCPDMFLLLQPHCLQASCNVRLWADGLLCLKHSFLIVCTNMIECVRTPNHHQHGMQESHKTVYMRTCGILLSG